MKFEKNLILRRTYSVTRLWFLLTSFGTFCDLIQNEFRATFEKCEVIFQNSAQLRGSIERTVRTIIVAVSAQIKNFLVSQSVINENIIV